MNAYLIAKDGTITEPTLESQVSQDHATKFSLEVWAAANLHWPDTQRLTVGIDEEHKPFLIVDTGRQGVFWYGANVTNNELYIVSQDYQSVRDVPTAVAIINIQEERVKAAIAILLTKV